MEHSSQFLILHLCDDGFDWDTSIYELDLYLGIDLSTQSCKATLIDSSLTVVNSVTVSFGDDLPQYHTNGGILIYDGGVVVSPTLMVFHCYYY